MKKIFHLTFLLLPLTFTCCTLNLLPNQNNVKFYDLTSDESKDLSDIVCQNGTPFLIKETNISAPYDGFQILVLTKDGSLFKLNDAQWISTFASLYKSKLEDLSNYKCEKENLVPRISTDLSANTDMILSINLIKLFIDHRSSEPSAETEIAMTLRSEATGKILKTVRMNSSIKFSGESNDVSALKQSVLEATIKCLSELNL